MKQILTTLTAICTLGLLASTASAGLPSNQLVELTTSAPTTVTRTAQDALGLVADCYGGYGGYGGGYGYAPVRQTSYYRGGGGISVNVGRGLGGYPYGISRGYGSRLVPVGYGRGLGGYPVGRGYRGGGSGVGVFLRF